MWTLDSECDNVNFYDIIFFVRQGEEISAELHLFENTLKEDDPSTKFRWPAGLFHH